MKGLTNRDDRGAGLVEYAVIVMLVALGSLVAARAVGDATSETFDLASSALSGDDVPEAEMTPQAKWEKAQADYQDAIAKAKTAKTGELAAAKDQFEAAKEANNSLPKAEKKAANAAAKADYKSATNGANQKYKASVQAAKDARADAKAEYKATK
jgi:Flp pilus assembly pilin Flp